MRCHPQLEVRPLSVVPSSPDQEATIDAIAKKVVARCAPEEMSSYVHVRDELMMRRAITTPSDDPLGFGEIALDAVATGMVTGIVLNVLKDLATESLTDAIRPWWKRAWGWLAERLGLRQPARPGPDSVIRPLSAEEISRIAGAVRVQSAKASITPEQAEELVEAVVEELTACAGGSEAGPEPEC